MLKKAVIIFIFSYIGFPLPAMEYEVNGAVERQESNDDSTLIVQFKGRVKRISTQELLDAEIAREYKMPLNVILSNGTFKGFIAPVHHNPNEVTSPKLSYIDAIHVFTILSTAYVEQELALAAYVKQQNYQALLHQLSEEKERQKQRRKTNF